MSIKSFIAKIWAKQAVHKNYRLHQDAAKNQLMLLHELLQSAANTAFGKDFHFTQIKDYKQYSSTIPLHVYEKLEPYIQRILAGEENVLWKGKPIYFAKTSGTTSGEKYIPITKESINHHIVAARNALFFYIHETGNTDFIEGKMIFLQGSPILDNKANISTGRLSGIMYHHVPAYLHKNRKPSYAVNCIENWEQKVDAIVEETIAEPMTLISGIPPWLVMYFEQLLKKSGKNNLITLFPKLSLLVYGGVNYQPYQKKIKALMGKDIDSIETYPASEGFIAYLDKQGQDGLLLNLDAGIFYEFIEEKETQTIHPKRLHIGEVTLETNYAIALSTNAGLWSYLIGDVIKFTSLQPYRIKVTGRISQYISAFGEHVIIEEIEYCMSKAIEKFNLQVTEFTVAPQVNPSEGLPYHEWFIECDGMNHDMDIIASYIDELLQSKNSYYKDLIVGQVIQSLKINLLVPHTFEKYLTAQGKMGGQNKVMRVRNDREMVDLLLGLQS